MTRLLRRLLGRMPIGWLQLAHNRMRLAAAVAGVAFANILVFVQLGVLGALNNTINLSYTPFQADIIVSASDANTLSDGSNVARALMYRALSVPGVAAAAPLYMAQLTWIKGDKTTASLQVYGLPPEADTFAAGVVAERLTDLALQDRALIDARTRGLPPGIFNEASPAAPQRLEMKGVALNIVGTLSIGGGFTADGSLIVSDQTFFRLFARRNAGTPSHLLLKIEPGADPAVVQKAVAGALEGSAVKVRTRATAIEADIAYQGTQRPVGIVFGFGVFIGVLVGLVIVYQVLSTDVADHLKEYATFKAIGYGQAFFLSILMEEAILLALLGFVPGLSIASGIYIAMAHGTGLPISMTAGRALFVLLGTIAACMASGVVATRKLARANPADLF